MKLLIAVALALIALVTPVTAGEAGCPIVISLEMKLAPTIHPGQWFTANYPHGLCGPDDTLTTWEIERIDSASPWVSDICYTPFDWLGVVASGLKKCERPHGKILHIITPGTYNVTALAPGGSETLFNVVVD